MHVHLIIFFFFKKGRIYWLALFSLECMGFGEGPSIEQRWVIWSLYWTCMYAYGVPLHSSLQLVLTYQFGTDPLMGIVCAL